MQQMKKVVAHLESKVKYLLDTFGFSYVWNAQKQHKSWQLS